MRKNTKLLVAIKEAGATQKQVARKSGVSETYISYAINGRFNLNPVEKAKIAQALNRPVRQIFED